MVHNKKRNKKLQKNENREKNTVWTEKDKTYDKKKLEETNKSKYKKR